MYPSPFAYTRPATVEETLTLLSEHGEEARILAGGQSLIPLLKFRLLKPGVVLDIGRISGLSDIVPGEDAAVLGALVRHHDVSDSPWFQEHLAWVSEGARNIGDRQVRSLGTVVGGIVEADPAGDWPAIALALGGTVQICGRAGEREVDLDDFFVGAYTTAAGPEEMVTSVRLRRPRGTSYGAYAKIERRAGDFALAGCAVALEFSSQGSCSRAAVALTGVGLKPYRVEAIERELMDGSWDEARIQALGKQLQDAVDPVALRGAKDYKRRVARAALERALTMTLEQRRRGERHDG